MNDLRYALRTFARTPALIAAAVVCLALGIGANATIFGVVDTLLFRPPPHVQDPERVVRLYFRRHYPAFGTNTSSITGYPLYTLIRQSARSEEHTSELQSRLHLVCRLLLEKKKIISFSSEYRHHSVYDLNSHTVNSNR